MNDSNIYCLRNTGQTNNLEIITNKEIRSWGSFTTLLQEDNYRIKRLEIYPGHRLSLHVHYHRSERFVVLSGSCKLQVGESENSLCVGQTILVPQCTIHRLENPGVIKLVLAEISTGNYIGEDDILRISDDYGRS